MAILYPHLRIVQPAGPDSRRPLARQKLAVMNHGEVVDVFPQQTSVADGKSHCVDEATQSHDVPVSTGQFYPRYDSQHQAYALKFRTRKCWPSGDECAKTLLKPSPCMAFACRFETVWTKVSSNSAISCKCQIGEAIVRPSSGHSPPIGTPLTIADARTLLACPKVLYTTQDLAPPRRRYAKLIGDT